MNEPEKVAGRKGIGGHHSAAAGTDEWLTPKHIIDALGTFDLDPATPETQPWRTATTRYSKRDDALKQVWDPNALVFTNPPYSLIRRFMMRLAEHNHGVALVFARTETSWWFESVWPKASGILFLKSRLHFCYPDGTPAKANAGGPSALIAYGNDALERVKNSRIPGALVTTPTLTPLNTNDTPTQGQQTLFRYD